MKKINLKYFFLIMFVLAGTTLLTGCEVAGDIFKAGIWVGLLGVALVIGLVIFVLGKMRK